MTDRKRPYGGTSKQRLTDLINTANKSSLKEGVDFVYGSMSELPDHPRHNTKIRLISKRRGKADSEVIYTRLGIDILTHLPPEMLGKIFIDSLPLKVRDSIEQINRALGLDLDSEEIEDFIFYDKRDKYPVRIRERASVAWLPSEIDIQAVHTVLLSSVWQVTYLDGLYPPPRNATTVPFSDFSQLPAKILLDLINKQNEQDLPLEVIHFGTPALTGADALQTTVAVSAAVDSGYRGSVDVVYNRVNLSFMGINEPDLVIETHERSMHAMIPYLNEVFGIHLTTDDIEDTPIPELEADVNTKVAIVAKPGSLVFAGSFDLTFTLPLIELSSVVTITLLDGLYPPEPILE